MRSRVWRSRSKNFPTKRASCRGCSIGLRRFARKAICRAGDNLVLFYQQYLPMIPQRRGDEASEFCMKMYARGIKLFKSTGNQALADQYTQLLAKLKSSSG